MRLTGTSDFCGPEYGERMTLSTLISSALFSNRTPAFWTCVLALACVTCADAAEPAPDAPFIASLLAIDADHASLCDTRLDDSAVRARLRDLADRVRSDTVDLPSPADPASMVQRLNAVVFGAGGVHSSPDLHDPCNLLVSGVLASGRGYCVGVASVYLSVAEELTLPVFPVATPSHVFLRYDDGTTRINIETDGGASIPDERYIETQRISSDSIRREVFMRNMSREQFLAHVRNNLGVTESERRQFERARTEYTAALALDRRLPAAWYNLGKDLLSQNRHREAARAFSKAIDLHPNDTWALNNRAMTWQALHKPDKARRDLEEALRIDPGFDQARQNLARLTTR
ncbi:MAG TPA: tetratricopeptide repeat protein [Candidatus Polarisedimenticolia bacterium]|nr:tetratricopeptide repeat protein [Candidatus Polarisedimenticolia bacterium]